MRFDNSLVEARFLQRLNRFAALVDVHGAETLVHVANSGRMRELLVPGYRVYLRPAAAPHRKTAFDLALVDLGGFLCSADSQLPPLLLQEAFTRGHLPPFTDYKCVRREVTFGESRLDLLLSGPPGLCYVEAKSVTLVEDGVGLFPDAPTERGRKHLISLTKAIKAGHRAAVVFVVQRPDATAFAPHDTADPKLGQGLRDAVQAGVTALAYNCGVDLQGVHLNAEIPVLL